MDGAAGLSDATCAIRDTASGLASPTQRTVKGREERSRKMDEAAGAAAAGLAENERGLLAVSQKLERLQARWGHACLIGHDADGATGRRRRKRAEGGCARAQPVNSTGSTPPSSGVTRRDRLPLAGRPRPERDRQPPQGAQRHGEVPRWRQAGGRRQGTGCPAGAFHPRHQDAGDRLPVHSPRPVLDRVEAPRRPGHPAAAHARAGTGGIMTSPRRPSIFSGGSPQRRENSRGDGPQGPGVPRPDPGGTGPGDALIGELSWTPVLWTGGYPAHAIPRDGSA